MKEFIINNKYKVKAKDLKEAKKKYLDWKGSQVKIEDIEYLGVVVEDAYPDVVTEFQRKTGMTLTNFNKYPDDDWRADFKHPKPVGGGYLIALLEPISDKKVAMEIWFSNNRSSYKQVNGTVSKCASEAKYMYEDEVSTVKLLNMAGGKKISEAELKRRLESMLKDSIVKDAYPDDIVNEFQRKTGMTLTNFRKYSPNTWRADFKHPKPIDKSYLVAFLEPTSDKKVSMEIWFSSDRYSPRQIGFPRQIKGTISKCISEAKHMYEEALLIFNLHSMAGKRDSIKDSDENYKGYQIGKTNYGWIIKKDGKKIVETETDSEARKYIDRLVKDEEMIKTPRGQFRLSNKSYEELKEEGWGLHHSHKINGKEYYIMGKDNRAIACLKDSATRKRAK